MENGGRRRGMREKKRKRGGKRNGSREGTTGKRGGEGVGRETACNIGKFCKECNYQSDFDPFYLSISPYQGRVQ